MDGRKRARTALDEVAEDGTLKRSGSVFRNAVEKDGEFQPEAGRYLLIIAKACPWANRCWITLKLKGLEEVIRVVAVEPVWVKTSTDPEDKHHGWKFGEPFMGCNTLRDFYQKHHPESEKFTVPILFCTKLERIVNNESSEIIRMFNSQFNKFATRNKDLDLFPKELRADIEVVNAWVYPGINDGVYRVGFSQSQSAYDAAVKRLFECLDSVEEILSRQRYLVSPSQITEADIRLFPTLIRFDEVYHGHFKCNKKRLSDYPNISNYVRDIYQLDHVKETVDMWDIKQHYHRSHPTLNAYGIVPIGPGCDFSLPHDRDSRFPSL